MASSDDEGETQPLSVSNYYFEDDRDAPVCFSVLPIQWSESESPLGKKREVFLRGFVDNGLQKYFVQVVAWRFDLSYVKPEISVLSKDGRWIKLERARKSYEETIRTILITLHFLSYVKKNPDSSVKSVWDNLSKNKEFRSYEVMPSQKDLLNHMTLMGEATKRDTVLAKSKLLLMFMEDKDKLKIKKLSDEEVKDLSRPGFIIDDTDDDMIDEIGEDSDGEDELFDSVCAICDNGGELLCCDGKCMRSFHANEEDGEESNCVSLGFSRKEVDEIQNFYCKNCEYNQHQCFACGTLGCSDKFSGAEVFKCASATCGFFYHPHCVAKLLQGVVEDAPKGLERKIAEGGPFTCPTHYCCACKEMENKKEPDLQFAVCRRCPKSYHRKCLPREIAFDDVENEDIVTRAWEDLLPNNRILIYCLKHKIDDELGTPIRDHIKFPYVKATVREINAEENTKSATKERVILNQNDIDLGKLFDKKTTSKVSKLSSKMSSEKVGDKKSEKISGSNISRKKANEASRRCLNQNKRSTISEETRKSVGADNKPSLGAKLFAYYQNGSEQINSSNQDDNVANNVPTVKPTEKLNSTFPPLDPDSERRLLALFKEATSSITLDNVVKEHKFATTHTHSLRSVVEKTITLGKLEGSVEAVRTALRMLEEGHSIRDAEAVCGPDVLNQIFKWKDKLKVYLAPVLYGNRYTSFGRHFTQVEKLEGIVNKLHWYVQNGDTIVDFCCGANDFSTLLNKKLEETGKRCSYRNFDLLPTKNDFNFEMRDWMTVQKKELPTGSQLIMGLNPPFGLKAALANKFIDKALQFRPKLLILIVPPETERLDEKRSPYDLVWEDGRFLSGKSFYLPGSVDNNDRQIEQWNVKPPPLYLWSRPDWTDKHKAIAQEHGHLRSQRKLSKVGSFDKEKSPASHTKDDGYDVNIMMSDHDTSNSTDAPMNESQPGCSPHGNVDRESQERHEYRERKAENTSRKRKQTEENDRRLGVTSPPNPIDGKSSVERFHPKLDMPPPDYELSDRIYRPLEPTSSSHMGGIRAAHTGNQNWPSVSNPLYDSGIMDVDEPHNSLLRDTNNRVGYRPYAREDENSLRDLDPRQHHYGLQNPNFVTSNYLSSHDPAYGRYMGPSYPAHGSLSELPYATNTPAMQRYAPRLDELNHIRIDPLGFEAPIVGRNGTFDHSMPQPGYGNWMPGSVAGSHHVYSRQNSADRFNE
ncbi:hypothetical protein VNO78_27659 [Psophocarpus tetragonolobus]|uniref:Zinc finger PHD-type domain-containing protein n=1 Tax=Psophocarpus tetragonolobus TaxID=3891 RepID=A0AAN9XAW0_PSOTE